MNSKEKEDSLTLGILETIESKNNVTQRHLADELNVALGLANSYLKRCVKKGLIKIHQAPANRYLYYLTPKGFAEKSRLTAEFMTSSFDFYRKAGKSINELYVDCENRGWSEVAFCGLSELAEIASLRTHDFNLRHVLTMDVDTNIDRFLSQPVIHDVKPVEDIDVYLVTSLTNPTGYLDKLKKTVNPEKILIPAILGLNKN